MDEKHKSVGSFLAEQSAALFEPLLELVGQGALLLDEKLCVRACNAALCKMLGYDREELLQLCLEDLRARDRRRESSPSLEVQLYKGERFEGFFSFRRKDNTELHHRCTGVANDQSRTYLLLLSPTRMIGQSFEVRNENEERLRMLIDQAPFAIQIFDLDGTLLHANHSWEQIWNVRSEDVVGRYNALTDPQIKAMGLAETIARVFAGEEAGSVPPQEYDPALTGIEGRKRFIELRFFHIRDEAGNIKYVCIQNEDVTDRKEAEAERQKLLAQLHQAQKMEAIGRLAGGVAHDFNNLLTGILGYVDLILFQTDADDPNLQSLNEIARAAQRAAGLTSQLLAFSRQQVVEPQVVVLNELVSDSVNMIRRLIGEDIELSLVLCEHADRVLIDPHQIDQVLMNLASNSRDAMSQGGKLVIETSRFTFDDEYIKEHPYTNVGEQVMLRVSDTGKGMDKETQTHVFEPFYSTKRPGEGTGLGLATVYGIVKQNRGSIELYSEPGMGTTVKIFLPRSKTAVTSPKMALRNASSGTETILLVEDEQVVRNLAQQVLSLQGYKVLVAEDPHQALEMVNAHSSPIHLLLTDVVMPKMNGRQLYERLSLLHPEMRVLFMSGYSEKIIVHHGVVEQDIAFLSKPFSSKTLLYKVRETLDVKA